MTRPVDHLITEFAKAGATSITFHPECSDHVDRSLDLIRNAGCEAGLAINPATSLHVLDHVLDKLNLILLMSVNPGFGGQTLIPSALEKIRRTRRLIAESGLTLRLAVDGGIRTDNIAEVASAGADTFIAGSAIFSQPDYATVIQAMRCELDKVEI